MYLVLGDQLTRHPFDGADEVTMVESDALLRRHPFHEKKLALVLSAMRHYRDELRDAGVDVNYVRAPTFADGFEEALDGYDSVVRVQRPAAHTEELRETVESAGVDVEFVPNPKFVVSPDEFDGWAEGRDGHKHEDFYRHVRRETGYLVDDNGRPEGGDWNYDDENQEFPPEDYETPEPPTFEPDGTTRGVIEEVKERFEGWGSADGFSLPVTRDEGLDALDDFVAHRLDEFGPYQDSMLRDDPTVNHSLLSPAVNLGLLRPDEVVDAVVDAYRSEDDPPPLNSVEGFVRQVLGWREYMRHVHRRQGDELHEANALDATRDLPSAYYDGETRMDCLSNVVDRVRRTGYSHHIERLMVLANFSLVYGADPHELNRWFRFAYVDAYDWVTTPNVVGMGSYASDAVSTKPYASSGSYIDRMSDFCDDCAYDVDATTGDGACPFNSLYWDFLDRNEDELADNPRMSLMYGHLRRKGDEEMEEIRERADEVRRMADEGEL